MKKYLIIILSWAMMLPIAAQTDTLRLEQDTVPALPWPQSLQTAIDTMIMTSPLLETSELGLMIYDLTADSTLYTYNHRHTLRPASNMKLVTAITALDKLGGNHQLRTSLYRTGEQTLNTLKGDLYCVGGMDPMFSDEDLNIFVETIKELGIDTIRGRIVADKTMKDGDLLGWGWCWDDDNPVLSPLLINGEDNFTERFVKALQKAGIVTDNVQLAEGKLPSNATYIVACVHTLKEVLPKMMKDSNNLYAEALFYHIAAASGARPATAKHARQIISKLVERIGLKPSNYIFADGSGLSLYNYLSPELEVGLLRYAWSKDGILKYLYPSLPIGGQDGTLEKRMRRTTATGNIHAKTGTLKGVTTLAGYCRARNGHVLCFSIMNQGVMQLSQGRDMQDRLCILMTE